MLYLLKRKSGKFWYRRRVPADIQDCIGKKFIKEPLETKDFEQAKVNWKFVDTQTDHLFRQCRMKKRVVVLSDEALVKIAANHTAKLLAEDRDVRQRGYSKLKWSERFPSFAPNDTGPWTPQEAVLQQAAQAHFAINELRSALALDYYDQLPTDVEDRILAQLHESGHKKKPSPKLFRSFVEAELEAQKGILARCEGETVPTPEIVPVDASLLSIETAKWCEEKKLTGRTDKKGWTGKTANTFLAAVRLFIDISGDKDISDYGKDDARRFKSVLLQYPANVKRRKEFQGLTVDQILKKWCTTNELQQCQQNIHRCRLVLSLRTLLF